MFGRGAGGEITIKNLSAAQATKTVNSVELDISATPAGVPVFYEPNHDAVILGVDFLVTTTAADAVAGSFSVGTLDDTDALVAAHSLDTSGASAANGWTTGVGDVYTALGVTVTATLADTLRKHTQVASSYPMVPAGTQLVASGTGANAAKGVIQIRYALIEKGL